MASRLDHAAFCDGDLICLPPTIALSAFPFYDSFLNLRTIKIQINQVTDKIVALGIS